MSATDPARDKFKCRLVRLVQRTRRISRAITLRRVLRLLIVGTRHFLVKAFIEEDAARASRI